MWKGKILDYLFLSDSGDCWNVKQLSCIILNATEQYESDGWTLFLDDFDDIFCSNICFLLRMAKHDDFKTDCRWVCDNLLCVVWLESLLSLDHIREIGNGNRWHIHRWERLSLRTEFEIELVSVDRMKPENQIFVVFIFGTGVGNWQTIIKWRFVVNWFITPTSFSFPPTLMPWITAWHVKEWSINLTDELSHGWYAWIITVCKWIRPVHMTVDTSEKVTVSALEWRKQDTYRLAQSFNQMSIAFRTRLGSRPSEWPHK